MQEQSCVVHAGLNRDLQQAAAKVTAAEQKQKVAEAQLAAEQEAQSSTLQHLEVRLLHTYQLIFGATCCNQSFDEQFCKL